VHPRPPRRKRRRARGHEDVERRPRMSSSAG
jgi:hypothetical protein